MTIIEAIKEVMRRNSHAMTTKEAYQQIIENELYKFKAADPVHIVNSQIRRHCKGIPEQKSYSTTKHFMLIGDNKYYFIDPPETISEIKKIISKEYFLPKINFAKPIYSPDILDGNIEFKAKVLKEWFISEYDVLCEKNSSEQEERVYVDVLDGPYETLDVLKDEFASIIPLNLIAKVAGEIENKFKCKEWSKIPKDNDIAEYFIENLNTEFYDNFKLAIESIKLLSHQSPLLKEDFQQSLDRMLYVHIITAMESYLSDAFTNVVLSDELNVRKLVEKTPELWTRTLNLGDIFLRLDSLNSEVQKYLMELIYHRLDKVRELYRHTLNIQFPEDLSSIFKAIINRHDIIHRNGKRKDGSTLTITSEDVSFLLDEVTSFVKEVDKQLK
jgi:hypothetical protein